MNKFKYVAKTKVLVSCAVTAQLICAFVFAYAKSRFSHDMTELFQTESMEKCFLMTSFTLFMLYLTKLII